LLEFPNGEKEAFDTTMAQQFDVAQ
jgi:hypothetical protein